MVGEASRTNAEFVMVEMRVSVVTELRILSRYLTDVISVVGMTCASIAQDNHTDYLQSTSVGFVEATARAAMAVTGLPIQVGGTIDVANVVVLTLVWIVLVFHMDKLEISSAAATMLSHALDAMVLQTLARFTTSVVNAGDATPAWIAVVFRMERRSSLFVAAKMPHPVLAVMVSPSREKRSTFAASVEAQTLA